MPVDEIIDPMEAIWEKVPKNQDGHVIYNAGDIPYLYLHGFVDSTQFTFDEWRAAFDDCQQADQSFLITKEKFLSLRRFRYEGPVFKPFNPAKVREGEWTDTDLKKLFVLSIKPSADVLEEVFWSNVKALKEQGFVNNGHLLINKAVKTQLQYLIDRFPSPRRRLEKEVWRIREEREKNFRQSEKRDASGFTTGKLASEVKAEDFKKLERKTQQTTKPLNPETESKTVDLKSLRKPSRKINS